MARRDCFIEAINDFVDILSRQAKRGDEFDHVLVVARDLCKDLVILQQRD